MGVPELEPLATELEARTRAKVRSCCRTQICLRSKCLCVHDSSQFRRESARAQFCLMSLCCIIDCWRIVVMPEVVANKLGAAVAAASCVALLLVRKSATRVCARACFTARVR